MPGEAAQPPADTGMQISERAQQALGIFPAEGQAMSLFQLLKQTSSPMGGKVLSRWLRAPLCDPGGIRRRQDAVAWLVADSETRDAIRSRGIGASLRGCPDLGSLAVRLAACAEAPSPDVEDGDAQRHKSRRPRASLRDLVSVYRCTLRARRAREVLAAGLERAECSCVREDLVAPLEDILKEVSRLQALVEEVVDPSSLAGARRWSTLSVRPSFHPELEKLSSSISEATASLESAAEGVRAQASAGRDRQGKERIKLERSRTRTWHLRVTKGDQRLVKKVSGATILAVQAAGTLFTTPKVERCVAKLDALERRFKAQAAQVEAQALQVAATYCPSLERLAGVLGRLDVLCAFAQKAHDGDWKRPEVLPPPGEGGFVLEAEGLRHPCVEAQLDAPFVPNSIRAGGGRRVCIVTGPNCGGKSTFIRSIGVAAVLAQVGSFVPCESMRLTAFEAVFTRIGASDNQTKGRSTFFAECCETAEMLDAARPGALLIVDELGRGTDTYDGFGIASAVCRYVGAQTGACCLFATHFHEVTRLAEEKGVGAFNVHVAVDTSDSKRLVMLHEIRDGFCDRSFGCHVARMAEFPESVVLEAEAMVDELERGALAAP